MFLIANKTWREQTLGTNLLSLLQIYPSLTFALLIDCALEGARTTSTLTGAAMAQSFFISPALYP